MKALMFDGNLRFVTDAPVARREGEALVKVAVDPLELVVPACVEQDHVHAERFCLLLKALIERKFNCITGSCVEECEGFCLRNQFMKHFDPLEDRWCIENVDACNVPPRSI